MEINQEQQPVQEKYPVFLKVVVIVGYIVLGLAMFGTVGGLMGQMPSDEIQALKESYVKLFENFPQETKSMAIDIANLLEVSELNYIKTKTIPFFAFLVAYVGNLLIRRRKTVGMHLVFASIIGAIVSSTSVFYNEPFGIIYIISNHLLVLVYGVLVFFTRKHLS